MRFRTQRKAIYAAMGLTVLALIGGFSVANLSLGGSVNHQQQGSHTTTVTAVSGLSWNATTLAELGPAVVNTSGCAAPAGCDVSTQSATVCAGSTGTTAWCGAGDFVEQVILNTTANTPFAGEVNLTLFVTAGGTVYTSATFHYTDSGGNTRQLIVEDFDIGTALTGPAMVTDVTVVAAVSVP